MGIRTAISDHYANLSGTLRAAADYLASHQLDVATRSLRSIATASGISPASYSRLARALGYDSYEDLREQARGEIERKSELFPVKARQLQDDKASPGTIPLLERQVAACRDNVGALANDIEVKKLERAADRLSAASKVVVIGALSSLAIAEYLVYMVNWFRSGWTVAGRNGGTLGSDLIRLKPEDAVIIISKSPYALRSVRAAQIASQRGACVVVITDSHVFPGLADADFGFVTQVESPQFFTSYAATVVLIETLVGMLVERAGPTAEATIRETAAQNRELEQYVEG